MKNILIALLLVRSLCAAAPLGHAPAPNDTYWPELWHLDNLNTNSLRQDGIHLNARAAWPITRGAGIVIAIVDDGIDLAHADLTNRALPGLHWNFETDTAFGGHASDSQKHGTSVAGMAIAEGNNNLGMIGIAPEARFASWNIFPSNTAPDGPFVSSLQRAKMFNFHNQAVHIQSHSWVTPGRNLVSMSAEENAAISNAVTLGRGGKGVVIVRAAGNDRVALARNVNNDHYTSDPRVITVAAIRSDGRVASYSTPGAAILAGAPSGDAGFVSPFSTDRIGTKGFNQVNFATDLADYVFASLWQGGTSSATPLVAGVAALVLSVNPELTYRDVQQILVHAARQTDPEDPGMVENGAGFPVSHNAGFGLVNAGTAVDLARRWSNRPSLTTVTAGSANPRAIPDGALRVLVSGSPRIPPPLESLTALPSLGLFPDNPTPVLPLVHVGDGASITNDLQGKGALIRRGGAPSFLDKIENARRAGAAFAIVYNNRDTNRLEVMGNTDFTGIPAVFITQQDGDDLANLVTNEVIQAQLALNSIQLSIDVADPILCEQVSLDLAWEHEQRGDVRVTLVSPMGTRSILQRLGDSTERFSNSWTFSSTHHFYESAQGTWSVEVSDQVPGGTGMVQRATLQIRGTRIVDADRDGLDDNWEQQRFASLSEGPKNDPDSDGYSNAREQILGTNPTVNENPLALSLAAWDRSVVRMNWPSRPEVQYEVLAFTNLAAPPITLATVPGNFPRTVWFGKVDSAYRFFQVREKP